MNLYIRQKVFSWGDKFPVKDQAGIDRCYVEGEIFSFGKKLHIFDRHHQEVAYVEQKLFTWQPRYSVFVDGRQIAQVVKEFTFFRPRYRIEGLNWEVEGKFWLHEYTICHCGRPIAAISKQWMSWGDSYELQISSTQDEIPALATVLAIDAVIDAQND